jgi:hypothetical protein
MPVQSTSAWHVIRMLRNRFLLRATHLFIVAFTVVAAAQTTPRELLNSERITTKFGSYGVAVLEQNDAVRVSNLFSVTDEQQVCRTFAVVRYADQLDPSLNAEHAAIVAGGSIGAVFAAAGWEVRKTHLNYGERPASAKLASLMRIKAGAPLAEHAYVLDVVKDGRTIEYAALVEIHHPDYLTAADLPKLYGLADRDSRRDLVAALLAVTRERVR